MTDLAKGKARCAMDLRQEFEAVDGCCERSADCTGQASAAEESDCSVYICIEIASFPACELPAGALSAKFIYMAYSSSFLIGYSMLRNDALVYSLCH